MKICFGKLGAHCKSIWNDIVKMKDWYKCPFLFSPVKNGVTEKYVLYNWYMLDWFCAINKKFRIYFLLNHSSVCNIYMEDALLEFFFFLEAAHHYELHLVANITFYYSFYICGILLRTCKATYIEMFLNFILAINLWGGLN